MKTTIKDQIHVQNLAPPFRQPNQPHNQIFSSFLSHHCVLFYFLGNETITTFNLPIGTEMERIRNLCSGQGAVAVEIVHKGEWVAVFQCCSLLFFVFDVHSHHYLHFLEGSVHLFHCFPTLFRENGKIEWKNKTVDLWLWEQTVTKWRSCFDFQKLCGISMEISQQRLHFTETKLM